MRRRTSASLGELLALEVRCAVVLLKRGSALLQLFNLTVEVGKGVLRVGCMMNVLLQSIVERGDRLANRKKRVCRRGCGM